MQQIGAIPPDPQRTDYTWGPSSEITGAPGDLEANKAVAQHYMDAWNQHNPEMLEGSLHPECVDHGGRLRIGLQEAKSVLRYHTQVFPDCHGVIHEIAAQEDLVASRWTVTGTHQNEGYGATPTGKKTKMEGITISRFVGGKVVEIWWGSDWLHLMQQMGAVPVSGVSK